MRRSNIFDCVVRNSGISADRLTELYRIPLEIFFHFIHHLIPHSMLLLYFQSRTYQNFNENPLLSQKQLDVTLQKLSVQVACRKREDNSKTNLYCIH